MKQARINIDRQFNMYVAYLFENGVPCGTLRSSSMSDLGRELVDRGYNIQCGNIR